jgi:hypothetical protein
LCSELFVLLLDAAVAEHRATAKDGSAAQCMNRNSACTRDNESTQALHGLDRMILRGIKNGVGMEDTQGDDFGGFAGSKFTKE